MDTHQFQKQSSQSHDLVRGSLSASENPGYSNGRITSAQPPLAEASKSNASEALASLKSNASNVSSTSTGTTGGSELLKLEDSSATHKTPTAMGQKRLYSWQSFSQEKLDAIAYASHKQKKARFKANPPKCEHCPHARFSSMAVYETHLQSKKHLQRVESKDAKQLSNEERHELQQAEKEKEQQQLSQYLDNSGKTATTTVSSSQGENQHTIQDVPESRPRFVDVVMVNGEASFPEGTNSPAPTIDGSKKEGSLPPAPTKRKRRRKQFKKYHCTVCDCQWKRLRAWKGHISSEQHMRKVFKLLKGLVPTLDPLKRIDVLAAQDSFGWGTDIGKMEEVEDEEEGSEAERISPRKENAKVTTDGHGQAGSSKNRSVAKRANINTADLGISSDEESEESEDFENGNEEDSGSEHKDPLAYLNGYNDKDTGEDESKSLDEGDMDTSEDEDIFPGQLASSPSIRKEMDCPRPTHGQHLPIRHALSSPNNTTSSLTNKQRPDENHGIGDKEIGQKNESHSMVEESDDMNLSD